jgi:hypothetical protein
MSEDLIPQPTTPLIHFNDEIDEVIDLLFEPDENDMYIAHLNDIHYEDLNYLHIKASDITVVRIIKEDYDEGTDYKEMMRSMFGNDIVFFKFKELYILVMGYHFFFLFPFFDS